MGAVILNGVTIGAGSIVAAGTLITERTAIPAGSLVMGSPGKVRRALTEIDKASIDSYARRYVGHQNIYRQEPTESAKAKPKRKNGTSFRPYVAPVISCLQRRR